MSTFLEIAEQTSLSTCVVNTRCLCCLHIWTPLRIPSPHTTGSLLSNICDICIFLLHLFIIFFYYYLLLLSFVIKQSFYFRCSLLISCRISRTYGSLFNKSIPAITILAGRMNLPQPVKHDRSKCVRGHPVNNNWHIAPRFMIKRLWGQFQIKSTGWRVNMKRFRSDWSFIFTAGVHVNIASIRFHVSCNC